MWFLLINELFSHYLCQSGSHETITESWTDYENQALGLDLFLNILMFVKRRINCSLFIELFNLKERQNYPDVIVSLKEVNIMFTVCDPRLDSNPVLSFKIDHCLRPFWSGQFSFKQLL